MTAAGRARRHAERTMTGYEEWSRAGWAAHLPGVPDIPAHVAGLGEGTIPGLAAASADRVPDRVALAIDGEQITHAELNAAAAQVAAWLAARLAPGDRVLLAARSSLGFVRCYLGALRAGATVVLANPGLHRRGTRAPGHRLPGGGRFRGQRPRPPAGRAAERAADRRSRRGPRRAWPASDPARPR